MRHPATDKITVIKGQLSCVEKYLCELMREHGEITCAIPGNDFAAADKLGAQCFTLQVELETFRLLVDGVSDRLRHAVDMPPQAPRPGKEKWLKTLVEQMREASEEAGFDVSQFSDENLCKLKSFSKRQREELSAVIARKRADRTTTSPLRLSD